MIDVGEVKLIKQRHFPVSPAVEKEKPGKVRLCLDCRKVNNFTEKSAHSLPQISGVLSRLPKANFISSLDLKDAYWQVPLEEKSREKTEFTVPGKPLYQFKVMRPVPCLNSWTKWYFRIYAIKCLCI